MHSAPPKFLQAPLEVEEELIEHQQPDIWVERTFVKRSNDSVGRIVRVYESVLSNKDACHYCCYKL